MYRLRFLNRAVKDLKRINRPFQKIIKEKLIILAENPAVLKNNIIALKGEEALYRFRVGSYRVIFRKEDDELIILIIRIGHRKEIYLSE